LSLSLKFTFNILYQKTKIFMDLELHKKVIIVTGGASGIGESICKKIAEEGGIPCILDHNPASLKRVENEIKIKGGTCFSVNVELTEIESCKSALALISSEYDRIDGIVNNAGLNDGIGLENGDYKKFINSLNTNVTHYFTITHLALRILTQSKGAIVNICSKVAFTGQGETSGYAAANGERLDLTKNWAKELFPFGVRVNSVVVAECLTPQYQWWINKQSDQSKALKEINRKIPLGNRMTTVEEIADTVLFLLSPKSNSINGQFWHVDGGYVHLDRAIHS
jgi:NAD(P)-dependent dehydrogenase (short-subunit alcohol dehydrogenase family)